MTKFRVRAITLSGKRVVSSPHHILNAALNTFNRVKASGNTRSVELVRNQEIIHKWSRT